MDGVDAAAATTVNNAGSVLGSAGKGISLTAGGTVDNTAATATITGGTVGIAISGSPSGSPSVVDNFGTVSATGPAGVGVSLDLGMLTNETNASIKALGTAGVGVDIGSGTLTNDAGAAVSGALDGVDAIAATTVNNAGSILGSAGKGISLTAGGTVDNTAATASITGGTVGVAISGSPSGTSSAIDNLGTISATGPAGVGVSLDTGMLTNETNASIKALGTAGVGVDIGSGTLTNDAGCRGLRRLGRRRRDRGHDREQCRIYPRLGRQGHLAHGGRHGRQHRGHGYDHGRDGRRRDLGIAVRFHPPSSTISAPSPPPVRRVSAFRSTSAC